MRSKSTALMALLHIRRAGDIRARDRRETGEFADEQARIIEALLGHVASDRGEHFLGWR